MLGVLEMYIYVIASSEDGPCKIGVSARPESRLSAIRSGSPVPLSLHYVEPIGVAAPLVEQALHTALRKLRCAAQNEWFNIRPIDARHLIRVMATAVPILTDDSAMIQDLYVKQGLSWVEGVDDDYEDEDDNDGFGRFDDVYDFGILDQFCLSLRPPRFGKLTFNDYMMTWDDGMRLRWLYEVEHNSRPNGSHYQSYFYAAQKLKEKFGLESCGLGERWVEWSSARELAPTEITSLTEIWNKFVPLHNKVYQYGPQWDTHGIDDCVDDVHLFCLRRDNKRGDTDCIVLHHRDFRAVLVPRRQTSVVRFDRSFLGELCPLEADVDGFVAPLFDRNASLRPFRQWYRAAAQLRDGSLRCFLENPKKRYPAPRPYDGPQPGAVVMVSLLSMPEGLLL